MVVVRKKRGVEGDDIDKERKGKESVMVAY